MLRDVRQVQWAILRNRRKPCNQALSGDEPWAQFLLRAEHFQNIQPREKRIVLLSKIYIYIERIGNFSIFFHVKKYICWLN